MRVTIEKLAYGGDGIARPAPDEPVVFVPRAAPGDVLEVEIVEEKPRFRRGRILEVIEPGADRIEPPCGCYQGVSDATSCGGCHYQHIRYAAQYTEKFHHVREALKRLGGMSLDEEKDPSAAAAVAESALAYRNKGTFHWNVEQSAFGLVAADSRTVLAITRCPLLHPTTADAYGAASAVATQLARDDERVRASLLSLVVRAGTETGDTLAVLVVKPGAPADLGERFADAVWKRRKLTSVQLNVNPQPDHQLFGERFEVLAGSASIREKIGGLTFVLDAETFLQVNTAQAKRLYDDAMQLARPANPERILDLYAGNGGLSLHLARAFPQAEVLAVESVAPAVARGKESAAANGIANVRWRVGKVESTLKKIHHHEHWKADLVVVDPPRAGLKDIVIETLGRIRPRRVVYVSCNPTTLARDVKQFAKLGFEPAGTLSVIDLFPQTFHVEAVLALAPAPSKTPAVSG